MSEPRRASSVERGSGHTGSLTLPEYLLKNGAALPEPPPSLQELFPGVRADLDAKVVEFDARTSPLLVDDPRAPYFFIETIVCAPDTREHESLFVTDVTPSHLHAALLAIGLEPGIPGRFRFVNGKFEPVNATGDRVEVRVMWESEVQPPRWEGGGPCVLFDTADPREWVINVADRAVFGTGLEDRAHDWVFAGSVMRASPTGQGEVYDADGTGVVIGLCSFGSEVIAWSRTFSPDASVDEPEWIADFTKTPPPGTPVRMRVQRATEASGAASKPRPDR